MSVSLGPQSVGATAADKESERWLTRRGTQVSTGSHKGNPKACKHKMQP